jgi:hypothetical protein
MYDASSTESEYDSSDSDDIRGSDTEEEEEVSEQVNGVKEIMDEALEAEQH